jgi:hypothetical protein
MVGNVLRTFSKTAQPRLYNKSFPVGGIEAETLLHTFDSSFLMVLEKYIFRNFVFLYIATIL